MLLTNFYQQYVFSLSPWISYCYEGHGKKLWVWTHSDTYTIVVLIQTEFHPSKLIGFKWLRRLRYNSAWNYTARLQKNDLSEPLINQEYQNTHSATWEAINSFYSMQSRLRVKAMGSTQRTLNTKNMHICNLQMIRRKSNMKLATFLQADILHQSHRQQGGSWRATIKQNIIMELVYLHMW